MAIETVIVDGTDGFSAADLSADFSDAAVRERRAIGLSQSVINLTQTDSEQYRFRPTVSDTVNVLLTLTGNMVNGIIVIDDFDLQDSIIVPFFESITDEFWLNDSAVFDKAFYVYLADKLILQGLTNSRITGYALIHEYINLIGALVSKYGATILESFNLAHSGDLFTNIIGHSKLLDELVINSATSYTGGAFIVLKDSVNISETITINQVLNELLQDVIHFGGVIDFDGETYTFVLNTENEAISTYSNFSFNSISGNTAATDTGIYELTGVDDSGVEIDADIKTGLMDFGSNQHKQVPYAYIGHSSNGTIIFKTVVTLYGNKKERWYEMKLTKDATDTTRIKLGRGVKSKYWQFELINVAGADFDVESIDLLPLELKRRV